jgi:hypothetical protein
MHPPSSPTPAGDGWVRAGGLGGVGGVGAWTRTKARESGPGAWLLLAGALVYIVWFKHVATEPSALDAVLVLLAMSMWCVAGRVGWGGGGV